MASSGTMCGGRTQGAYDGRAAAARAGILAAMAKTDDDPIRELLAGLTPALFMGNPTGTVVIMESKVVDAGGDPDEVLEWVREHGGYPDKSFAAEHAPRPRADAQAPRGAQAVLRHPRDELK